MHEKLRDLNTKPQVGLDGTIGAWRDCAGFVNIKFQCGPVEEVGVNGTSIENVLDLLVERLECFQAGPFVCDENGRAIGYLKLAIEALEERTKKRVEAGVEGTSKPHRG